ncbi:MAG: hypothetical protein ACXWQZ_19250 [Ktedonobacterales bacterium]
MAQTSPVRERGQTNNTAKSPTTAKSTSPTTSAEKSTAPGNAAGKGFFSALLSSLSAPKAGADGQKKPGLSKLLRFTLVLVVFMFVIQGLQIGLLYAEQTWHLGLTNFVTSNHSTPILGGLRWFDLIFFVVVIGFYFALIRFNILPRDLFTSQPGTAAAARKANAPVERPAGSGRDRSRAARRRAAAVAEAQAAAQTAKNVKGDKKAAPAPVKETASDAQASGEHDAEYSRVKAAQRLQRRRSGKR